MHVLAEGRLIVAPTVRETKSGTAMANAVMSVRVDARSDDLDDSMVFSVVAFGEAVDQLALHAKGDSIAVTGTLQRQTWNGELRFGIVADAVESVRTSRERARRQRSDRQAAA